MSQVLNIAYGEKKNSSYNARMAMEEASRCLLCHDAPCSKACPAGTDPGKFIRSLRFRNVKGAAETIRTNNPFGGSCSTICPHAKLCEEACSRCGIDKAINIGKLQEYAVKNEMLFNMEVCKKPETTNGKHVLCIGAGPASLTVAATLAKEGYEVDVFESKAKAGGILTYGINPSRIEQEMVDFDIELIEKLGVNIVCNKEIKKEDLKDLSKKYDAVHVGVGLSASKIIAGENFNTELEGVESAITFLEDARTKKITDLKDKNIIVIGGGDVAMDCAMTASQLGASTRVVYRRSISEAPANIEELQTVEAMGISITTEFSPEETVADNNKLKAVKFTSRDGFSNMELKADMIIFAIGQKASDDYMNFSEAEGIFASGDISNGGKTVVHAVAEGKETAARMIKYMKEAK